MSATPLGLRLDMDGSVAVVTGGSRGLGREMVQAFAAAGASVVIASRKLDACEAVAAQVRAEYGVRALAIACHVGKWDDLQRLVDGTVEEFGGIDVLINNAGMAPLYTDLPSLEEPLFDKVLDVNLKGPFRLGVLAAEQMAAGRGGSIVNISSIAAQRPQPGDLPYAAAKAGLNVVTEGLALAYGPTVRVNGVMVGPFLTDISQAWNVDEFEAWAARRYPLRRLGGPAEIVGTILYLTSPMSSFTTGATVTVDGGVHISSPFPDDLAPT